MRKGKIREIRTKSNKKKQDDDDAKSQLYYEEHEYSEAGYNFTMMKNINCSKIQILDEDNNIISFSADKTFYFYNLIDKKVSHSSVNKIWNVQKWTTQKLSRQQQCCIFNKEYFIFINSKNQIFVWKYTEEDAFIEMLCETPYETQFTGIQFVTPERILIVNDKVIEQWDLESFELMNFKQFSGHVNSSISKFKNNYLISNGFNLMRYSIDEDELKFRDSFRSRNKLSNYKYNEDGNFIYITFNSNFIFMLYSKTKKQIRKFKMNKVQLIGQIEAYKDQIIVLNSVKCRIQFIQIYDGSETLRLKIDESQDPSFALSSDQSLLISNDCHGIKGWYLNQLV